MKKKAIILSCLLAAAIPMTAVTASAEPAQTEGETVNLFETESDWKHNKSGSTNPDCVKFENGVLKVTPRYVVGSTYCARAMGQGRISFTYQMSYPDNVSMETPEDLADQIDWVKNNDFFFGVLFSNSPLNVRPSGDLAVPFNEGAGGFPYMVAFDSEKQNVGQDPTRNTQLGLTLRRYKFEGSHDFTRWSSVNPTETTYLNADGKPYESKIPDFYKPVTLADCFDLDEHRVDVDVKNLYTEKGDAVDAVQIEIYFDDELAMRVIDEMPFESDGYEDFTDKREYDGWISTFAYAGTTDATTQYDEFTVNFKSFTVQFRESNGSTGGDTNTKKGCASSGTGVICLVAGTVLAAACALGACLVKRKRENED